MKVPISHGGLVGAMQLVIVGIKRKSELVFSPNVNIHKRCAFTVGLRLSLLSSKRDISESKRVSSHLIIQHFSRLIGTTMIVYLLIIGCLNVPSIKRVAYVICQLLRRLHINNGLLLIAFSFSLTKWLFSEGKLLASPGLADN